LKVQPSHLLNKPIARVLLLFGSCFLAITPFFWKGIPSGHDFEFHVYSWMEVLNQWKLGIAYPRWAALAHWGYGEPRFLFYPPASWTLGALLGAVLPWNVVPGAYCWLVLSLAGASMYWLVRQWLSKTDALFVAIFYALNPYHLLIVYWRSAYAELLASALIPLVPLFLLRISDSVSQLSSKHVSSNPGSSPQDECQGSRFLVRAIVGLSLTLAAAWLTNLPAAVMIHYSTAGLAVILTARSFGTERSFKVSGILLATAGAAIMGAGLASFYLLPAIYEQRWINISEILSPGVRPEDNFLFTTLADADHNRFNRLVSIVAIAEIIVLFLTIVVSSRHRRSGSQAALAGPVGGHGNLPGASLRMLISAWGVATTLMMLPLTNWMWQHLPKLRFVQLPFRWLLCMNAALAVLLVLAARHWISRLLTCAALLATLLIAGQLTQPPWWDNSADIREMVDFMESGTGHEGVDEYVPAGADASELNKDLPRVSDEHAKHVPSKILAWEPATRHFQIHAKADQNIVVRLFNYPAWQTAVNGKPVITGKTETTRLMVIPIEAGENDVYIHFGRTTDRTAGVVVSMMTIALLTLLVTAWRNPQSAKSSAKAQQSTTQEN
jgi:hypothetical protein